jgi:hypothetical protein
MGGRANAVSLTRRWIMPITQEDVDRVLAMTRGHYRSHDAPHSSINLYEDPPDERQRQRNGIASAATDAISEMRRRFDSNKGMPEIGAFFVINGITAGNCAEMTSVSSHFCVTDTHLAGKMTEMWVCQTPETEIAAHTFLVASDGCNLSNIRPFSIEALADLTKKAGVWVIDAWLDIACHASEYKDNMMEKCRDYAGPTTVKKKGFTVSRSGCL